MYLRVLIKESDFTPLNRVHIHNRFISESLTRSSDIYSGSLNSKNKIDIVAAFCFNLFSSRSSLFDQQKWFSFAKEHKLATLKEFDEAELLDELKDAGIFGGVGNRLFFRYSFFFSFFLGRYLASNRTALIVFLEDDSYIELPSVIDVISGLEADSSLILEKLCGDLENWLAAFADKYVKPDFDPLLGAVWPDRNDEEEKLWKPVFSAIEQGPRSVDEIDVLKSSAVAEARTADQKVIFEKFSEVEHNLFFISTVLADALRNSDDAPAELKLRSLDLILRSELVAFQVGTLFADKLASRKQFRFGAVTFTDFNSLVTDGDPVSMQAITNVVVELSFSVSCKIADEIGTYKLGNVFRTASKNSGKINFIHFLLFSCILEAKSKNWFKTLESIILIAERDAFYLSGMLHLLMRNLEVGIDKGRDREETKRLVAVIHSKRGNKKMAPGEKLVSATLKLLEEKHAFDRINSLETNEPDPTHSDSDIEPCP
jgi:hypothetical protein